MNEIPKLNPSIELPCMQKFNYRRKISIYFKRS